MDIYKFRRKLDRYLKGQSNETENALIESWYKSYDLNEKQLSETEEQLLQDAIYRKISAATSKPPVTKWLIFRIAASLLIFSCIALLTFRYHSPHKQKSVTYATIKTGTNEVKQLTLPDSSVIWLNSASSIKIPSSFKGHIRKVILEEGEAFFKVKRSTAHPFIVYTEKLNVQVLGTSFNIRNYKNLKDINVAVATGKVGITSQGHTLAMLLPGQQLSSNRKTGKYNQSVVNPDRAQSWKSGYTYLTAVDFKELSLVLKNIFGLSLHTSNSRIGSYRFTLRVQHNVPADQILKVISQIHNTHFRREGNNVILY